jgi:hypothetical protein
MQKETFEKVIDQLRPWTADEWSTWEKFALEHYEIDKNDMCENHFLLYVIPKVIVLHGYGDPLLDKNIPNTSK